MVFPVCVSEQAIHAHCCISLLSKLLNVKSTDVEASVKSLIDEIQKGYRQGEPNCRKAICHKPLVFDKMSEIQEQEFQVPSTFADPKMEANQASGQIDNFRNPFRLLWANVITADSTLPPLPVRTARARMVGPQSRMKTFNPSKGKDFSHL